MKAEVVPNSVDCKEFKKFDRKKARKELSFDEKDFIVLFVGNAEWVKGLRYLVDAVKGIPDSKLSIVGLNETGWIREALGKRVSFAGYVPHKELSKYYSAADVLCVPSVYEAFGLMYAEAQCFGIPCIGSRGTGAEEVIGEGVNGFLAEKRDSEGIENALSKIMNAAARKRLSGNALKQAGLFSAEKSASTMLKICNSFK
ncbi:MAG: glycosyltransferase family 4 protein [Candidatus Diapherotrites archaeon]